MSETVIQLFKITKSIRGKVMEKRISKKEILLIDEQIYSDKIYPGENMRIIKVYLITEFPTLKIKEITKGDELNLIHRELRRKKNLNRSDSIYIWRITKILNNEWDHQVDMTTKQVKDLLENDSDFKKYYESVNQAPII